jgi:DNA-binding NarL/FixJ family response regulator
MNGANAVEVNQRIRILVVDDHPAVRKGLVATLEPESDFEIVGAAASVPAAVELHRQLRPDITLMDLALESATSGLDAIQQIRKDTPGAKVIVFSALRGEEDIYRALHSGATTYLSKGTPDEELVQTVREVHAGGRPIPPDVARKLADRLTQTALSPREVEVLKQVAEGLRNKEIAAVLHISEETVQGHLKNILAKLGVNDRTRAAIVAAQRGIIHLN